MGTFASDRHRCRVFRIGLVTLVVPLVALGGCNLSGGSAPTPSNSVAPTGIGQFGVSAIKSEIRIDVVMFEDVELFGSCNGVQFVLQSDRTSFEVFIDGGPLDPVTCQMQVDGRGVVIVYEPTAEGLQDVISSSDCVALGASGHLKCPADSSFLNGGDTLVSADWFVADEGALEEIEA